MPKFGEGPSGINAPTVEDIPDNTVEVAVEQIAAAEIQMINTKFELSDKLAITVEDLMDQYNSILETGDEQGGNSLTHKHADRSEIIEAVIIAAANMVLGTLESKKTGDPDQDEVVNDKISKLMATHGEKLDYARILNG